MSLQDAGLNAEETQQLLEALAAIRQGDFSAQMSTSQSGMAGEVAESVNALVDQLQKFAVDVSRLAATTSVQGNFGAQMSSAGATGIWKDLTDNLNHMSLILATQVRDIARVADAVAQGDLSQKVIVTAEGEMGELKATFNTMIDQLELLKNSVGQLVEKVNNAGLDLGSPPPIP
ncbi:MAG: HAMP domain-containing protein [Abitibacteriaceae bacterium]|nr:HAMP domain-containing protein [Abditibacteriaceae bacterium]